MLQSIATPAPSRLRLRRNTTRIEDSPLHMFDHRFLPISFVTAGYTKLSPAFSQLVMAGLVPANPD